MIDDDDDHCDHESRSGSGKTGFDRWVDDIECRCRAFATSVRAAPFLGRAPPGGDRCSSASPPRARRDRAPVRNPTAGWSARERAVSVRDHSAGLLDEQCARPPRRRGSWCRRALPPPRGNGLSRAGCSSTSGGPSRRTRRAARRPPASGRTPPSPGRSSRRPCCARSTSSSSTTLVGQAGRPRWPEVQNSAEVGVGGRTERDRRRRRPSPRSRPRRGAPSSGRRLELLDDAERDVAEPGVLRRRGDRDRHAARLEPGRRGPGAVDGVDDEEPARLSEARRVRGPRSRSRRRPPPRAVLDRIVSATSSIASVASPPGRPGRANPRRGRSEEGRDGRLDRVRELECEPLLGGEPDRRR